MQTENSSYFVASRHKLSAFFSLIFRFSSCHHPLIASALAKIVDDHDNRTAIGKDENAVRQLISMISSEDRHVVSEIFLWSNYALVINAMFMFWRKYTMFGCVIFLALQIISGASLTVWTSGPILVMQQPQNTNI